MQADPQQRNITATQHKGDVVRDISVHDQDACTSIKNANVSIAGTHLVRVTHPFHPLSGQQLVCRGKRYNRYGMTLLLEIEDGSVCSVPPQWTDLVAPDPEIVLGERRALFRVVDLLELARLVERLRPDNTQEE
jgi:hypothetical protein